MDSLFSISNDLKRILEDIEIQDGEITPEQEEDLIISEANLKEKLEHYRKAILILQYQEQLAADEIKRLQSVKKTKDNIVNRLKTNVLNAVLQFGEYGKSGNKIIECETSKFFTANTKSVVIDENKISILIELFFDWANSLNDVDMLDDSFGSSGDFDPNSIINIINKKAHEKEFIEDDFNFTVDDLYLTHINISYDMSLLELLKSNATGLLRETINNEHRVSVISNLNKVEIKKSIENNITPNVTIASIEVEPSLRIK